jgi:hypothetical protein
MLKFFDADPGSGMGTIRIRDGKKSDPGINIPDPQHWYQHHFSSLSVPFSSSYGGPGTEIGGINWIMRPTLFRFFLFGTVLTWLSSLCSTYRLPRQADRGGGGGEVEPNKSTAKKRGTFLVFFIYSICP